MEETGPLSDGSQPLTLLLVTISGRASLQGAEWAPQRMSARLDLSGRGWRVGWMRSV